MEISKYISDLLFEYECVVIPGLGGFIANDKPAQINFDTHYFKPPYREVMFNPYLSTNDGLLLNHIAGKTNLAYKDVRSLVDEYVADCIDSLNNGKQVAFEGVGVISKDNHGKIIFEQDRNINYNPDTFGLTPFISPAVHQTTDEEKIKGVIAVVKPAKENRPVSDSAPKRKDRKPVLNQDKDKSWRKRAFLYLMLLLFGLVTAWGVINKDEVKNYYAQYGSRVPVFYGNPGSYLANNVEIIPVKAIGERASGLWLVNLFNDDEKKSVSLANEDYTFKEDNIPEGGEEAKAMSEPSEQTEDAVDEPEVIDKPETVSIGNSLEESTGVEELELSNSTKEADRDTEVAAAVKETPPEVDLPDRYFIIAGSFKNHANAERLVTQLQADGFDAAIAGVSDSGMTRVAYNGFRTFHEAVQQLSVLRQHDNPSAWIMKK